LGEVDLIACEDTRKTGLLLKRLLIPKKRLLSYYEENELKQISKVIRILQEGQNVALVSSAGTPTISDPGFKLVRECWAIGIRVIPIPGPSAVLAALTVSGLPTDRFLSLGYPPKKEGKRKKFFENLKITKNLTVIFFESPHRLIKTLKVLKVIFGSLEVVVCSELTKIHENVNKQKVDQLIVDFEKNKPRGEYTLLFRTPQE